MPATDYLPPAELAAAKELLRGMAAGARPLVQGQPYGTLLDAILKAEHFIRDDQERYVGEAHELVNLLAVETKKRAMRHLGGGRAGTKAVA